MTAALHKAEEQEIPVALWRLPGTAQTRLIVADAYLKLAPGDLLEELDAGFVIAPFEKSGDRYFLPADRIFTFHDGQLQADSNEQKASAMQWLRDGRQRVQRQKSQAVEASGAAIDMDAERQSFLHIVEQSIAEIGRGSFEKVVPSRRRTVSLPASFDLVECFHKLCEYYPEALISFVRIPAVGAWLGASPEVLVCVENKSTFKTVALAGTQAFRPGVDIRSVSWTQKEIEEQALVGRYVISCFKKIRLREYNEQGPKTVVAGNLMHLKSEYTVDMKATSFPHMGSVMLDLLHPTSAVCGMPLDTSLAFLRKVEAYDRGFYAGYLGPVNVDNNMALFVNLRCMQLSGATATLYAGAGVTIDSVPEKEWEETEMKFETLLNVLH